MLTATVLLAISGAIAQTKSKLNQTLERGTLRVGTTGDFNPMSIKDTATNTLTGFDIEAMNQPTNQPTNLDRGSADGHQRRDAQQAPLR